MTLSPLARDWMAWCASPSNGAALRGCGRECATCYEIAVALLASWAGLRMVAR